MRKDKIAAQKLRQIITGRLASLRISVAYIDQKPGSEAEVEQFVKKLRLRAEKRSDVIC